MSVEAISAVGELVGALGIILSLIYLSRQISHSAKVSRLEGYERLTDKVGEISLLVSSTPQLAELMGRVQLGEERRDNFDVTERIQIGYIYFAIFLVTASLFERHRSGLLSQTDMHRWIARTSTLMDTPYLQDLWPILRPTFTEEVATFLETMYPQLAGIPR